MSKVLFYSKLLLASFIFSSHIIEADVRTVNSTSNDANTIGTLPYWILNANDGDTIDCSSIAGQQITLTTSLPAITKSYTINGSGITINGDNIYQAFQVATGTVVINNINIQNAISKGGNGGDGYSGGGGAVGGGGALYIHGDTSVTLTSSSLLNNIAQGGDGGSATDIGNAGAGGGGGFGGGNGGSSVSTVSTGGGGGGHSNGGNGGSNSPINGSNGVYFGGGGGGAGINSAAPGGSGGNASPDGTFLGGSEAIGNGGGGAGDSENGNSASAVGLGSPGDGGNGIGNDMLFGGGGGGGSASETGNPGGMGIGAAGGGGGAQYSGGAGGILGGGGGAGIGTAGGAGGFGAGGGGSEIGGTGGGGFAAGGGNGASVPSCVSGGGGGSGLGGAIFIQSDGQLIIVDSPQISGNNAIAGIGGSSTHSSDPDYIAPGNGAAMGQDIFMRQGSSLVFNLSNSLTLSNPIEGDNLTNPVNNSGYLIKRGSGILELNGTNTYVGLTTIEQGNLKLNGSINNDLLIEVNSKLSGNAIVKGNIINNGTIKPGNSIGTVLTTNLTLSPSSIYVVEIDPASSNLINASGTASLAGKVLVVQDPGSYSPQGRYTILTSAGGLSGSINSLEVQGLPGFKFSLEQDNFNLYLNYISLPSPSHVRGKQVKNQFVSQTVLVNILKWNPPTSGPRPLFYNIYRNDLKTLIGVVPAHGKLEFKDGGRPKNVAFTYYIVGIDEQNNSSSPAQITIKPKK